jgi:serine protease Do
MKITVTIFVLAILLLNMSGCIITFPETPETINPAIINPGTPNPSAPPSVPAEPINPGWVTATSKNAAPLPSIADVVERIFPSVVAITTETVSPDIFRQLRKQEGSGSGWIIDKNGIIVTNNHVVEGAKKIVIKLADGRTFETDQSHVYRDAVSDIAVVKIEGNNFPAASLGDPSKLRVGDWVVAIGNPLGQGLRAKEGTVSGLKVSLPVDQGQTLSDLIEVSAAINPGNSGGPLANMSGQVIGITSAKMAAVGVEGMGYAISISSAIAVIDQLIKTGYVIRPYLGIAPVTVDQYVASVNRLTSNKGVVIAYVYPGGPADKAGLKAYDVITHFKEKEVTTADELVQAIHNSQIDEEVKITFIRDKANKNAIAKLIQSPAIGK